jgi:hypothetical protein
MSAAGQLRHSGAPSRRLQMTDRAPTREDDVQSGWQNRGVFGAHPDEGGDREMRIGRAILFGILGGAAISLVTAVLRAAGLPLSIEIILGTLTGLPPGGTAFGVGLLLHLAMGGLFGLFYGFLFEHVWDHGGATTGMLTAVVHASLIGILIGLTPQFHPYIPERMPDPGPYFANLGVPGALTFFGAHLLYGAIVGAGYGHVEAERQWAPTGRL